MTDPATLSGAIAADDYHESTGLELMGKETIPPTNGVIMVRNMRTRRWPMALVEGCACCAPIP
ncbi:MAG: hypothetical protein KJ645_06290 [Planctomycetes bacterium]|nr:hypothetical protein [Planctomycetota bacterium]